MALALPGLPDFAWTGDAGRARRDPDRLILSSEPNVDWINDPWTGTRQHDATAQVFTAPAEEFTLSARLRVEPPRTTFDAGVLCVWASPDYWAKLCFEYSPDGQAMVVSVVTNEWSDDCNSVVIDGDEVHLRVSRSAQAWAFHSSTEGQRWDFVRAFRLRTDRPAQIGFLAQSPTGPARDVVFDQIALSTTGLSDLRDGS